MSETLYRKQPDTFHDDQLVNVPLELAEDFSLWAAEMEDTLMEFSTAEVKQLIGNDQEIVPTLQEQYNLPFNPEKTIRGIGGVGLVIAMGPGAFQREIEKTSLDAVSGHREREEEEVAMEEDKSSSEYAQDLPEFQEFVPQATAIIYNLRYGDESGLSALPPRFQEALSIRMNQRINELNDRIMTDGEFELEITKMISVACVGLRTAVYGEQ